MLAIRTCYHTRSALCLKTQTLRCAIRSARPQIGIRQTFTSKPRLRQDDKQARTANAQHINTQSIQQGVKPENVSRAKSPEVVEPVKADPLLGDQKVSNKEQRKADWAIMKDMVQYLWPKNDFNTKFRVGLSVALLVGAKVCSISLIIRALH